MIVLRSPRSRILVGLMGRVMLRLGIRAADVGVVQVAVEGDEQEEGKGRGDLAAIHG